MLPTHSQRGGHYYSYSQEKTFVGIPQKSHQVMTGCGRNNTVRLQMQTSEDKGGCPHRTESRASGTGWSHAGNLTFSISDAPILWIEYGASTYP